MTHLEEKYDSAFLRISAHDDEVDDGENSEIEVSLPGSSRMYSRVVGIQVTYVGIPHVFYNIPEDVTLDTTIGSDYIVPKGFYTATELLEKIKVLFEQNTNISDFSYNIDPITKLISFTLIQSQPLTIYVWNPDSVLKKLGFDTTILIGHGTHTFTGTSLPKLSGPQQIFICCPEVSVDTADVQAGMNRDVLVCVPVDVDFGETIHFTPNNDVDALHEFGTERSLNTIFLSLRDAYGNLLKMGNSDWTIFMKVYYID